MSEHIEQAVEHVEAAADEKAIAVAEAARSRLEEAQKTAESIALASQQSEYMQRLEGIRKEHETWVASEQEHRRGLETRLTETEARLTSILERLSEVPAAPVVAVEKVAEPPTEVLAKTLDPLSATPPSEGEGPPVARTNRRERRLL